MVHPYGDLASRRKVSCMASCPSMGQAGKDAPHRAELRYVYPSNCVLHFFLSYILFFGLCFLLSWPFFLQETVQFHLHAAILYVARLIGLGPQASYHIVFFVN